MNINWAAVYLLVQRFPFVFVKLFGEHQVICGRLVAFVIGQVLIKVIVVEFTRFG